MAGDAGEAAARRWLESTGLQFIAATVRERGGVSELIMRDGQAAVFVEVRSGRS
ncbi:YraN family protein, partial [Salmonella enterica subsp. enterica serovar Infantis]